MRRSALPRVFALVAFGVMSASAWAITYEYDALGRLVKVTYDDGSYVVYEYDEAGNRITVDAIKN